MDKDRIYIDDIARILQGEVPWEFYIELLLRGVVVYLILIAAFRLMGKRMSSRMTRNELAAVVTLAAAIGIPLQTPERGLLPGLLIASLLVVMQRVVASRAAKNENFERLTQGKISTLVADGHLQPDEIKRCHMSRERVFSQLRVKKIRHLGEVKRMYLEANGAFTTIKATNPPPGLCILPDTDIEFRSEQPVAADVQVCGYCGQATKLPPGSSCSQCGHSSQQTAIQ